MTNRCDSAKLTCFQQLDGLWWAVLIAHDITENEQWFMGWRSRLTSCLECEIWACNMCYLNCVDLEDIEFRDCHNRVFYSRKEQPPCEEQP